MVWVPGSAAILAKSAEAVAPSHDARVTTYSVLLLTRYERRGPSSRVRHYNFLPALEHAGFRVTVAPFLDDEYLDRYFRGERRRLRSLIAAYCRRLRQALSARRYDLLWIEKEALPWLPAALERALLGAKPLVIDFDDPWYLRYANNGNPLVRVVLGRKLETVAARATALTAGSPVLARWATASGARHVVEMPPAVDIEHYPLRPFPEGPFTVGWIGTPRNEAYLSLIAEPLRCLHAAHGARLRVIGGTGHFSLPGVPIDQVPWREDAEGTELARCHVGVMPLTDGPWERGKCGYKLIQYMAAGRPAVASPVGASPSLVFPGETGYLAADVEEWSTALANLAGDPERVQKLGTAARRHAETKYSLQVQAPRLIALFRNAVGELGLPDGVQSGPIGCRKVGTAPRLSTER